MKSKLTEIKNRNFVEMKQVKRKDIKNIFCDILGNYQ